MSAAEILRAAADRIDERRKRDFDPGSPQDEVALMHVEELRALAAELDAAARVVA